MTNINCGFLMSNIINHQKFILEQKHVGFQNEKLFCSSIKA